MNSLTKRLVLDVVLAIILVVEMLVQITGVFLHEVIGAVLLVTVIIHLVFERAWIAHALKRRSGSAKPSPLHVAKLVVAILLLVDLVVLGISSVLISTVLFDAGLRFDSLFMGGIWYPVHSITAYLFCALVVVHLAIHWTWVANSLHVSYDKERRAAIGQGIGAVATLGVIALCVGSVGSSNVQRWLKASEEAAESSTASVSASSSNTENSSDSSSNTNANANANSGSGSGSSKSSKSSKTKNSDSNSNAKNSSSSSSSSSDSGSGSSTSDTCPLCPKRCSLSNPQCERPYDAGLISR